MNETVWETRARQAQDALGHALASDDPTQAVKDLSEANRAVEEALREAMAAAVLDGASMRKVAEVAGIAPNSVPPRLARTKPLAPYTRDGSVTADMIAVARHDAATGRTPMVFTPRRKDSK